MKNYLLIQALGLIGTFLFFISFQCKSNKNLTVPPFFPLLQILRRQLPDIHIMRAKSALPECLLIPLFG